jgi:hypothetical protein
MDQILNFLQTPLGQIAVVIVVALLFGKNPDLLSKILEILQIKKPKVQATENLPDRDDAFVAANILTVYYENKGEQCKEGLEAAKKAGQCLFH